MIPFNRPYVSGKELEYISDAVQRSGLASEDHYSQAARQRLQSLSQSPAVLLTPSCTHALEICALLLDIQPGDEIIMPSFTFVSAANAFVLRGARIVFVDIHPDTMNIDEGLIEAAITPRSRALVLMHYAGVACNMEAIMEVCQAHQLYVIEDAAQAIGAYYKGRHLGSIGHLGTLSFHYTKNIQCGEGGALLINDERMLARAEILREKGTNRKQFMRGEIDKYSWVDIGSSYLLSELNAAFLLAQLEQVEAVNKRRLAHWRRYAEYLVEFCSTNFSADCQHNAHTFFIKCQDSEDRQALIHYLAQQGIKATFHYVPLHSAEAGRRFGHFHGQDRFTTAESERLLRLPMYYELEHIDLISKHILRFYGKAP
ncbi:MAG: dTDP-4-amino-4,6-dideoxygalactose transaminase [Bacteroidota bacterium]